MSVTDEIKARIDIVELVSETVKLRRAGKSYTGFCPFHTNTRTPAFVVFPDSGTWRCFGQCNEGGDIFRFVMKKEGWDFPETLRYLAERAGVVLQAPSPEREVEDKENERLRNLLEEAVLFYRHQLLQTPAGKDAQQYLNQRGIQPETIEKFELGYAPEGWDITANYFSGKGYSPQELLEVGLLSEREDSGRKYDRFRHRIMFPIRDGTARMSGFGARILRPDDVPKFLNSPQTPLFDKGRLLYGLHLARKPIRAEDQVVIVEGYLDVIALHQAGFGNSVSPMGTALTEDQLRLVKRFTRRVVLALDADAAGEKATLRGLEVARQALDHSDEIAFDARGLLRHEARLEADVRVTTLPAGLDPDDVVLRDPDAWKKIVEDAKPIVVHVMESLAAGHNLDDPKAKSEIAAQVLPLIADVPNPV
ncbi:MAG: DNA primase, partial [Bellilinea sp.]